jgi:hypothetical protein
MGACFIAKKFCLKNISKAVPHFIELFISELAIFQAKQRDDISSFNEEQ